MRAVIAQMMRPSVGSNRFSWIAVKVDCGCKIDNKGKRLNSLNQISKCLVRVSCCPSKSLDEKL